MKININDAAKIVDILGDPAALIPETRYQDEIFGPYHHEGQCEYLFYKGTGRELSVISEKTACNPLGLLGMTKTEIAEATERLMELSFMEKPAGPAQGEPSRLKPFTYRGWSFYWVFYPDLMRWELAPIGRI